MLLGKLKWGSGRRQRGFLERLAGDKRGNVAMLFALAGPVLMLFTFGGVDLHRASSVRVNLRDALDAAALAAARSPHVDPDLLQDTGLKALKGNLAAYPDVRLKEETAKFTLTDDGRVVGDATVELDTWVANIFLPPYGQLLGDSLPVSAHTEVDRSSKNLEVALVLDVTGSMAGSRISALKEAAKNLVDLVVSDTQTPYYSKVALIPYSAAVNPGEYADESRGDITGSVGVTHVGWADGGGKAISAISKSGGITVTANGHGFASGDVVWVSGVSGMTDLNNRAYVVEPSGTNKITLRNLDGSQPSVGMLQVYLGNGSVTRCLENDCSYRVTAAGHGLADGDYVYLTDVRGMSGLNNKTYQVKNVRADAYALRNASVSGSYTGGGQSWCAQEGCTYFAFTNAAGGLRTNKVTACATERTGSDAYTDEKPRAGRYVGRDYPASSGNCLGSLFRPLSADRDAIKTQIDGFRAEGTTAGHIGIAWGWYALSPSFSEVWEAAVAGPYRDPETLKAAVIMTDGEFNTNYCKGVIAKNAGQGSSSERINCDATNGSPFAQAKDLCDGMKAQGILIYTVGFQISGSSTAAATLRYCASTPANFHIASQASDLSDAFAAIGRDITALRISK